MSLPLRYKISNWHQLKDCQSNNSRLLRIEITDLIDEIVSGVRIQVIHQIYGPLFTYVVNPKGTLLSEMNHLDDLTASTILYELKKFGFYVTYEPSECLSGNQLDYLITLSKLKYDKIRIISVWHHENSVKQSETKIVAFKVSKLGDWLNNGYSPSRSDFNKALDKGYAINLTQVSDTDKFDWSWLYGFVADINDILSKNANS